MKKALDQPSLGLFSIGVQKLNGDGTTKVDPATGHPIPTFQNDDIQVFARAWTCLIFHYGSYRLPLHN
jgi:hypothetical protein